MSASIFNGAAVKILKNILKFKDGTELTSQTAGYLQGIGSDVQDQLDDKISLTEKGAPDGVAELDSGGKVPVSQLPNSIMNYLGTWAASTNTPTLTNGTGDAGDVYVASDAGTVNFGAGNITFAAGDWVVYNGTIWQKSVNSNAVASVNGFTGVVVLDTDDVAEGATNKYFSNAQAQAAITGAASTVTTADLTASRAMASDGSGKIAVSSTTATELGYVSGVTSAIQTQIDGKASTSLSNLASTAINAALAFGSTVVGVFKTRDEAAAATTSLTVQSGDAAGGGASGAVTVKSGTSTGAHDTGAASFGSGDYAGVGSGASGTVSLSSGVTVNSPSGTVTIQSGNSTSSDSGSVTIKSGTAGANRGSVILDGSEINASSKRITTVADPTSAQDASTKNYTDAQDTEYGNRVLRNYLQSLASGASITGINTYNDGASAVPTDGTGGTATGLTTALNTSTPLRRTSSQRFSKDAANRQGMGWSVDFTADRADYEGSLPLWARFRFKTSAAYASGDVRAFLYDITNGTVLNVLSLNGDGSLVASPSASLYSASTNLVSTSSSYRLIFHITSTNASAWDLDLIDLSVGPQVLQPGAIVTEWTNWTPTGSWVTNTTYAGRYRRVGENLECDVTVSTSGAPTSATLTLNLPNSLSIDTDNMSSSGTALKYFVSSGTVTDSGNRSSEVRAVYSGTATNVQLVTQNATNGAAGVTQAVPITFGAGDTINIIFQVPISGWAASAALSTAEAMLSTAVMRATGNPASATSGNPIIVPTTSYDNLGAYNNSTGAYTAPRTGKYRIHGQGISTAAAGVTLSAYVAGVSQIDMGTTDSNGEVTYTGTVTANKGEAITVRPNGTFDSSNFVLCVEEIPDFSVFSVQGQWEILTATSATKTPTATATYSQMTSNSLVLGPGTWRLVGSADFNNNGTTPAYTSTALGWYAANGADSGVAPASLTTVATIVSSQITGLAAYDLAATSARTLQMPVTTIRTTAASTTIFLVPFSQMSTAANARITVYPNAERVQ